MNPGNIISKYAGRFSVLAFFTLMLAGCGGSGGGGDSNAPSARVPLTLTGVGTVGDPLSGATVQVLCTNTGPASTAPVSAVTKTGSDGSYTLTLSINAIPPCLISASGGKTSHGSNKSTFNSVAVAAGTANVTPLTDLIVHVLTLQQNPSSNNAKVVAANTSKTVMLKAITPAAVTAAIHLIAANLVPFSNLSDPITTPFSTTTPDPQNNASSVLQTALANTHATPVKLAQALVSASPASSDTVTGVNVAIENGCAALLATGGCSSATGSGGTGLFPG